MPYCAQHRCSKARCKEPREGAGGATTTASLFCQQHTCESPLCASEVDGTGEAGSAARFCGLHRRCAKDGCARPCHLWDSRVAARHCGEHYCREGACEGVRRDGSEGHCADHACTHHRGPGPPCPKGRKAPADLCADHKCADEACANERLADRVPPTGYCAVHACAARVAPLCRKEAVCDRLCENHQECGVDGCRKYILVEGETRHERCEDREWKIAPAPLFPATTTPTQPAPGREPNKPAR